MGRSSYSTGCCRPSELKLSLFSSFFLIHTIMNTLNQIFASVFSYDEWLTLFFLTWIGQRWFCFSGCIALHVKQFNWKFVDKRKCWLTYNLTSLNLFTACFMHDKTLRNPVIYSFPCFTPMDFMAMIFDMFDNPLYTNSKNFIMVWVGLVYISH